MSKIGQNLFYSALFLFILALCFVFNNVDPDFFARVMQGDAVLQTGHVLFNDPFSYTQTHAWIDHEWGSGVIFAVIQKIFGYAGQVFLKAIILFFIIYLIIEIVNLNPKMKNKPLNFLFFVFVIYAFQTLLINGIRCHFFTFLFFTLFLYILEIVRKYEKNKLLYLMPLIMIFWANIHGGCVSGIGLLMIYALGEALNRKPFTKYLITALACSSVIIINPYGFEYIKFLLMATTMHRTGINEWNALFSTQLANLLPVKIFVICSILLFIEKLFRNIKFEHDFTEYITLLVVFYIGLSHIKQTPFVVITSMSFLYCEISFLYDSFKTKIFKNNTNSKIIIFARNFISLFFIMISLLVISSGNFVPKNTSYYPYKVVEFIKDNNLKGKLLNEFGIGSYLAYKLYPHMLIFMDGRYEEVYYNILVIQNDDFYIPTKNWENTLNQDGGADYVIVRKKFMAYENILSLAKSGIYKEIFGDENYALFCKKELFKSSYLKKNYSETEYGKKFFDKIYKFKQI